MSYLAGPSGSASSSLTSVRDRSSEFHSYVAHHRAQIQASSSSSKGGAIVEPRKPPSATTSKGEFARKTAAISKDISNTTMKLSRLAELAKKKSLFDDRPVEISELTYIIKHDLAAVNRQLADLQAQSKATGGSSGGQKKGGKDRGEEHRGNVVTLLQSNLANATTAFQDVLEVRTQNMKASRDRSEQFGYSGSSQGAMLPPGENSILRSRLSPAPPSSQSDSPLYNPSRNRNVPASAQDGYDPKAKGKMPTRTGGYTGLPADDPSANGGGASGGAADDFLALDMGASKGGDGFMQMQLMENGENQYMQQRSTAIESIESTISELGQIFSQLAHMVAEQRETVQRIDENILDVADNVSGAQRELLKYYNTVASNRWLMLKIFGTLIVFFLLFILVS